jgi:hypothetical protein
MDNATLHAESMIAAAAAGDAVAKLSISTLSSVWGVVSVAGGIAAAQIYDAENKEEQQALIEAFAAVFERTAEMLRRVDCGCDNK